MQFRILTALVIFLGSYLPLSMILLAQDYDYDARSLSFCFSVWEPGCQLPLENSAFSVSIFCVCLASFLVTLLTLSVVKPKHPVLITEARHIPTDLMNYTLPYVVSFMSIDYQETSKLVGLVIFLAWMFVITYRSGQILLNPLLIVFGWRFYDVTYSFPGQDNVHAGNALVQGQICAGERHAHRFVQDLMVIKNLKRSEP